MMWYVVILKYLNLFTFWNFPFFLHQKKSIEKKKKMVDLQAKIISVAKSIDFGYYDTINLKIAGDFGLVFSDLEVLGK